MSGEKKKKKKKEVTETGEAMEASMLGLELHVPTVAMLMSPSPTPDPSPTQTPHSHCELRERPKSHQLEFFWLLAGADWFGLVLTQAERWVGVEWGGGGGERDAGAVRRHGSTYISGSEDSVMRAGTTL